MCWGQGGLVSSIQLSPAHSYRSYIFFQMQSLLMDYNFIIAFIKPKEQMFNTRIGTNV